MVNSTENHSTVLLCAVPRNCPMTDWKISLKATLIGAVVGAGLGLAGFFFLTSFRQGMGEVLFLLVPVTAGFSIALVSRGGNSATAAGLLAVLSTLAILVGTGREGSLCAALAFPIIIGGLFLGLGIGVLARKLLFDRSADRTTTMGMVLLIGPLLVFVGGKVERQVLASAHYEVVRDSVTVNASPEQVWSNLLSIDKVQSSRPFLMYIGLPVPLRCTLQGRGVGARRTCYFNSGYIEETVTGWDPPNYMGLTIDRTHMPGRHWLGFESAEYRVESLGMSTLLTRTTKISSHLLPRWYWRPFERLGVRSEHRYILRDVMLRAEH